MTINFDVTRRALTLGLSDAVTGWYAKTFATSTKEVIIIMKGSSDVQLLPSGVWLRSDALGMTQDAFVEGDELYYPTPQKYYEVKTVRDHYRGNTFDYRELDLVELPLHE